MTMEREVPFWFLAEMNAKLLRDKHKGNWRDEPVTTLLTQLFDEVDELVDALRANDGVVQECADVANFAMMIADVARSKVEHKP